MTTDARMRVDRIDRLLRELRYEIERGIMDNEISEQMSYDFVIPMSRTMSNGCVVFQFRLFPTGADYAAGHYRKPVKLRIVDKE